jgi:hypothetical protein
MWRKNWRKKGEKGEESDGKKDMQYAFIRSRQAIYMVKREGEKSHGKKKWTVSIY